MSTLLPSVIAAISGSILLLSATSICVHPSAVELKAAIGGGDCEDCSSNAGACSGETTCKFDDATGLWGLKIFTNITPQECKAVAKGANGWTKCDDSVPKACTKILACTEVQCNNCTNVGDGDPKNTQCSTSGGYLCTGK